MNHILSGQGFEIEFVGGVVVGRNGFWVGVDHDRLIAVFSEGEAGMDAAIVELDSLSDPVWATAENEDLWLFRRSRFVIVHVVSGVVVGCVGLKFGSARIDKAIGGMDRIFLPPRSYRTGSCDQLFQWAGKKTCQIDIGQACLAGLLKKGEGSGVP